MSRSSPSWLLLGFGLFHASGVLSQQPRTVVAPLSRIPQGDLFTASMKLGVGSPPQIVTAILDTGSSDLWVPQVGSALCNDPLGRCSGLNANDTGAFDGTKSSTFSAQGQPSFFADYVNGVTVFGTFMTESVTVGNTTVANNTMGFSQTGTLTAGLISILGVGPVSLEASVLNNGSRPYDNFPAHLKAQGQTTSLIYGVYLNDFRAPEGSVVFGGMDTAKLAGEMQIVPLIGQREFQTEDFIVPWTSFSFTSGRGGGCTDLGGNNLPPVLLDTGNPGLSMSQGLIDQIGPAIGVQQTPDGINAVKCSDGDSGAKFTFGFQAATIDVPLALMLIPVEKDGAPVTDNQGNALCTLPLDPSDGNFASLGAPMLSAAYAVFDMENQVVGMAQAKINATETNIQELQPDWLRGRRIQRGFGL